MHLFSVLSSDPTVPNGTKRRCLPYHWGFLQITLRSSWGDVLKKFQWFTETNVCHKTSWMDGLWSLLCTTLGFWSTSGPNVNVEILLTMNVFALFTYWPLSRWSVCILNPWYYYKVILFFLAMTCMLSFYLSEIRH